MESKHKHKELLTGPTSRQHRSGQYMSPATLGTNSSPWSTVPGAGVHPDPMGERASDAAALH